MAEAMVDTAGVSRTTEGTIVDGQTTQTDQSSQTTNQDSTSKTEGTEETSLLNQKEPAKEPAKEEGKKDEKSGAPEAYADYTMPDGFTLDPEVKGKADALFKGMGLTQEQAQSLVDFYRETTTEAFNQPFTAYQEMRKEWRDSAVDHPDLKGKIGPGKEVSTRIAKALDSIGDAELTGEFRKIMDVTGAGDHPAFIRVLNFFAKQLSEGGHVSGNGPAKTGQSAPGAAPPSAAAAMWPNLKSAHNQ